VGVAVAGVWSYLAVTGSTVGLWVSPVEDLFVRMAVIGVCATAEEVVSRALLLTALLGISMSRFQAVFLSSIAFGLMHVPGTFAQPVFSADWPMFQAVAFGYAPEFLMQTLIGLFLGVLWLRTGSITLIALTHALFNVGSTLVYGL